MQLKKKLSARMRLKYVPPFAGAGDMPQPDIYVFTSAGQRICAHSKILVHSPIFDSSAQCIWILFRFRRNSVCMLQISFLIQIQIQNLDFYVHRKCMSTFFL